MTNTRKDVHIRIPESAWREAKSAAALTDTPLWAWIAAAITYTLRTRGAK